MRNASIANPFWHSDCLRVWVGLMRRSWRQFHLSTAVVLMFMAGLLLWLNFSPASGWDAAVVVAKQIRPLQDRSKDKRPDGEKGGGSSGYEPQAEGLQSVEFVDFRLGGWYRTTYGWPWSVGSRSWELLPMVCVQPVEIPEAWRRQAIDSGQSDLTFLIDGEEAKRLFGDNTLRFGTMEGEPPSELVSASDRALNTVGVVANTLTVVLVLLAVGVCSEWLLRRKEGVSPTHGK